MIKNIPKGEEFERLGLECITKAFEMIYKVGYDYSELSNDGVISEEVTEEAYWEHNAITVRTSFIVFYQGLEYLMKMKISQKSSLLLIDNNKADWPTLPAKKDKNFDELITISGENLLNVFCAIVNSDFELEDFVLRFEKLRLKRNKLVHSTGVKDLDYKLIVKEILFFLSKFYVKDKWIELFREMFVSHPTFGYWDWDIEGAHYYQILNFVESTLTKGELNKYLPFDIKSRRYFCPTCTYWLNKEFDVIPSPKWTFLTPNSPESTMIKCLVCNKEHEIERQECETAGCKGNVTSNENYENQCLTCSHE